MLNEQELAAISRHKLVHDMGLCTCPCFEGLMKVGLALEHERELMAKLGTVSPIALAAVVGADVSGVDESDESET